MVIEIVQKTTIQKDYEKPPINQRLALLILGSKIA
jgi:hypothetical protein